jgi:hypothetical protein
MIENIHKLWNECVDKTNDVVQCLELYTKLIKEDLFEEVENLSKPLAGDFGETPIYKDYQELKKRHLSTFSKEKRV